MKTKSDKVDAYNDTSKGLFSKAAKQICPPNLKQALLPLVRLVAAEGEAEDKFKGFPVVIIILLAVTVMIFMIIMLPHAIRYFYRCFIAIRPQTVVPRVVRSFPVMQYNAASEVGVRECHICLSEFEENEEVRVLPCFHIYHHQCIFTWMCKKMSRRNYSGF
ncbi:hypothetical protein KY285_033588 [Solanum tuberosum]|nr:hypothetical protein KY285_033588 [Solanum tuberosum]